MVDVDYAGSSPRRAAKVLSIRMQLVMGPTPPGTGVIHEHLELTASKSTSPRRREPLLVVGSGTRVVPTSITIAPSLTISSFRNPGTPSAATIMSA